MTKYLKLSLFILLCFTQGVKSQKVFHVTIKFPEQLNTSKVKIFYENGKEFRKIKGPFTANEVTISDSFYSKYAIIDYAYYATVEESQFVSRFFVWDSVAVITFNSNEDTIASPFSNYKL